MKIGIVCYPTFGGSGVVATELGLRLAHLGHQIHFITYQIPARLSAFHKNIHYHEVLPSQYPLFDYSPYESALASKMVDVAICESLDIFHVHYAIPHAAVAFLSRSILRSSGRHIPFITTLHGTDISLVGGDAAFAPVVEFSINASDGVTAVSNHLKKLTEETFEIKKPIEVIHNFVDLDRFKQLNKNHFKKAIAPNGDRIITHVSNFRQVKRIDVLVRAFHQILQKISAKLLLVGDGPERQNIEKLCRDLHIFDQVIFLGRQDAVEEILAISDLFILTSEKESFGLSVLEAMACRVPAITTDVGGLPEVNIHGITGYLVPVNDHQAVAHYAIDLLSNEEKFQRFSNHAFERAKEFNIEKIVQLYENYYHKIIENSKIPTTILD